VASFFISHSSRDSESSERIRERLRGEGYGSVFLDFDPEDGIPAGRDWERELYAQLRSCDAVVYLCSAASLDSKWCFAELSLARATGKPVFPIALEPAARHPLLADTQSIEWVELGSDGEAAFERLWSGFRSHGFDPRDAFSWDPSRPPFPGLSPLEAEDAAVFFGRSAEIDELVSRLQPILASSRRLVGVIGPSGSGKSSLVRAGLVPRLRRMGGRWAIVLPFKPGARPLSTLARRLAGELGESDWRRIRERIERDPTELAGLVDDLLAGTGGDATSVLLVIDQAEELVTADADERTAFLDALGAALEEATQLWVVATIRSEYVTAVLQERAIANVIGPAVVIGRLDRSRIPEVIEEPARKGGVDLDPGLAGRMVEETVGGDALPLLAYTLRQLYDRAAPGRRITTEAYEAIGGVVGALRGRADAISAELAQGGKGELVIPTLLRFATVEQESEPIGRRVLKTSLSTDEGEVVRAFVEARLLTSTGEGDEAVIGVAHDSLLRSWGPLRQAIDASRENLRLRSELERLAREWDSVQRLDSYLLREERLAAAAGLLESELGREALPLVQEFVRRSSAQSQAALRRESELLAGRALDSLDEDPERSLLLALAAVEEYTISSRAIRALNAALADSKVRLSLRVHAGIVSSPVFSPDGERIVTASSDGTARLWDATSGAELHVLRGHEGTVSSPAFSPDGERVVTASEDGTARLWDVASGEELHVLRAHGREVRSALFSPDGTQVVTASEDGTARVWDVASGEELHVLRHEAPTRTRVWRGGVKSAVFSPDGARVVTASRNAARLWDAESGGELHVLRGHEDWIWSAVFSPDGARIVTASEDGTSRLWDAASGEELQVLRHEQGASSAVFSPDGERILTASSDGTARLWDAASGGELQVLPHSGAVWSAVFSPDGERIVTASEDGTSRLWYAATGWELQVFRGHELAVMSAVFSPSGERIATESADGTARIWDAACGGELHVLCGHESMVWSAAFSPSGERIVTASDDGTARLWDAASGRELHALRGHEAGIRSAVFSPDGGLVVTASDDGTARIWDAACGGELQVLRGHESTVSSAAFSPNGERIVTASSDGTARLWDATSGAELHVLRGHEEEVRSGVFSPDGELVVTASEDATARLWGAESSRELHLLRGHERWVSRAVFSPDGKRIVTASDDRTARLWESASGAELHSLFHEDQVWSAVFSPDGERIVTASSDGTARLWDAASGGELQVLRHVGMVWSAAFSPDGEWIVTASSDRTAGIWEASSRAPLHVLRGHEGVVWSAVFSPDGARVVTASEDGTARVWETLAVDLLIAKARSRVTRELTDAELAEYGLSPGVPGP
jgi:WD40 repeat protein